LDLLFVQMQFGHRHASTTAIYTAVDGDSSSARWATRCALSSRRRARDGARARLRWRLRLLLAERGIFAGKPLVALLAEPVSAARIVVGAARLRARPAPPR
jgi:hypothetical protein